MSLLSTSGLSLASAIPKMFTHCPVFVLACKLRAPSGAVLVPRISPSWVADQLTMLLIAGFLSGPVMVS